MAMLWGTAFVATKGLLGRIPAADQTAWRFGIAVVVLALIRPQALRMSAGTLRRGTVMGLLFGTAQLAQTYGLERTSASVSAFITGLYLVIVALIEAVALRSRLPRRVRLAVILATVGMGVLTLAPGAQSAGAGLGEVLTVICAIFYAAHIVVTGRWSTVNNALSLTLVQGTVVSLMAWIAAIPGGIAVPHGWTDWGPLLYLGVICGSVTLFLQIWAQSLVNATSAAVVMSTEPVWATVAALTVGQELLSPRIAFGGAAMLAAMMLAVSRQQELTLDEAADGFEVREAGTEQSAIPPGLDGAVELPSEMLDDLLDGVMQGRSQVPHRESS